MFISHLCYWHAIFISIFVCVWRVYVHGCVVCGHVCIPAWLCTCVWRPKVNARNHLSSVFYLITWCWAPVSCSELPDVVGLLSKLTHSWDGRRADIPTWLTVSAFMWVPGILTLAFPLDHLNGVLAIYIIQWIKLRRFCLLINLYTDNPDYIHFTKQWKYLLVDTWFLTSDILHFICKLSVNCFTKLLLLKQSNFTAYFHWQTHLYSLFSIYWHWLISWISIFHPDNDFHCVETFLQFQTMETNTMWRQDLYVEPYAMEDK